MATTRALFGGYDSSDHINIWVTNGTARGTTELTVAGGGVVSAGGVQALDITVLRGEGFFSGKNADNEYDLWGYYRDIDRHERVNGFGGLLRRALSQ